MIKQAGMETTSVTDPSTGRAIRVSTTARLIYRKIYAGQIEGIESMRNAQLNEIIAEDFANSAGRVVHYFQLGKKEDSQGRSWAEIRNMVKGGRGLFQFYVSAIRSDSVDILVIQGKYIKTKFRKKPQDV